MFFFELCSFSVCSKLTKPDLRLLLTQLNEFIAQFALLLILQDIKQLIGMVSPDLGFIHQQLSAQKLCSQFEVMLLKLRFLISDRLNYAT
jgi:hypothetical protein